MRLKTKIILASIAILLIISLALAQTGKTAETVIQQNTHPSRVYYLTSIKVQVLGITSGGGYYLSNPFSITGSGTPCCCNYLPCILRNY